MTRSEPAPKDRPTDGTHVDRTSGLAIAEEPIPDWCAAYLTERQIERMLPRTVWAILLDFADLDASEHHVALRLHLWTSSNEEAEAYPSIAKLARATKLAENTAYAAVVELERQGWLIRQGRVYPKKDGSRGKKRASTLYRLAWPERDVIACSGKDYVPRCYEVKKDGSLCIRRAGWGTDSDEGPCKYHRSIPQPLRDSTSTIEGSDPSTAAGSIPQPLRQSAVCSDEGLSDELSCARSRSDAEERAAQDLLAEGWSKEEVARYLSQQRERVSA